MKGVSEMNDPLYKLHVVLILPAFQIITTETEILGVLPQWGRRKIITRVAYI